MPEPQKPMQLESNTQSKDRRFARGLVLFTGLCLMGSPALAAEDASAAKSNDQPEPKAEAEEEPEVDVSELKNWVNVSVGGVAVDGDKAQFMKRHNLPRGAFGGVEGFHYEKSVGKEGLFKLDGRGIFDLHDYNLKLDYSYPDKGYVRAGYREYRTWYDGSGGFLPQGEKWFSLYNENLHIDRGDAWFEAGLTMPDLPILKFRYDHKFRRGLEDSTSWGDYSTVNRPNAADPFLRGIVPSFRDIDEKRDIFELTGRHTIAKTTLGLGLRYETSEIDDSLNVHRRPGESFPGLMIQPDRYVTTRDKNNVDLFNVHGSAITRFNDKLMLTAGASFTTLDSDLSGSRFYGAGYDLAYDLNTFGLRALPGDEGYWNLSGGSQLKEYVVNLNLAYKPWEYFSVVPSVRVEKQDTEASSIFDDLASPRNSLISSRADSDRDLLAVSERLDLRYSRLTNWVFYGRAEWAQDQGNKNDRFSGGLSLFSNPLLPDAYTQQTDYNRFTQKYSIGANWYPWKRLNFAAQYYHKMRNNDYDHSVIWAPQTTYKRYPGFIDEQEFDTDDVNFRFTLRPLNNLTFVSRYDFQLSRIDTRGNGLTEIQSAETTSHIFGESISWVPCNRLFLQASANVAFDKTETPANDLAGADANLVLPSKNDYWSANFMVSYNLNAKTDLQANYSYYRANNFVDNSSVSVPYGADDEEHAVTLAMIRRINARMRWTLKYGYFDNRDYASGGYNDYQAHMVYSSIQYLF